MSPRPLRTALHRSIRIFGHVLSAWFVSMSASAAELGANVYSEPAHLAPQSLLLDAAAIDGKMVVVGERGHVLISGDGGSSWKQVLVPTRATLTAVYFVNDQIGYAAGHDAVILKTEDGGSTWALVHQAPEEERPLFDIWFGTPDTGIAVGAYGYYLETEDGGRTWTDRMFQPQSPPAEHGESEPASEDGQFADDLHLYRLARSETGKLFIAAEAGTVYRSDDEGASWLSLPSPYEGSFFGVVPLAGDSLLLFGLQGRVFRSEDAGISWARADTGTQAILMDGARFADGTVVIVGFAGTVLRSSDDGRTFDVHIQQDRAGLAAVLPSTPDQWVLIGENGVRKIENPWAPSS